MGRIGDKVEPRTLRVTCAAKSTVSVKKKEIAPERYPKTKYSGKSRYEPSL